MTLFGALIGMWLCLVIRLFMAVKKKNHHEEMVFFIASLVAACLVGWRHDFIVSGG